MKKKDVLVKVCPNCGWVVNAGSFVASGESLARSPRRAWSDSLDVLSGIISCPKCNFSGLPIEVKLEDYKNIQFKKKKIDPFSPSQTRFRFMRQEFAIGALLCVLAMVLLVLSHPLTSCLSLVLGLALMVYGLFFAKRENPQVK